PPIASANMTRPGCACAPLGADMAKLRCDVDDTVIRKCAAAQQISLGPSKARPGEPDYPPRSTGGKAIPNDPQTASGSFRLTINPPRPSPSMTATYPP